MSQAAFEELRELVRAKSYLKSTQALLEWDQETLLPKQAGKFRADQIAFLAGEVHARATAPRIGELLNELADKADSDDASGDVQVTVRELKREYDKKVKLPHSLVKAMAHASASGQQTWIEARKANDFKTFAPKLEEIFKLKQEQADALGHDNCRYDALLDEFEPHAKTAEVAEVLQALKAELVPLVAEIAASEKKPNTEFLRRNYPIEAQRKFGKEAAEKIGFDFGRGRIDVTFHPFCTEIGPNDVRITTRFDESFFNTSFFGTLHESGHGIYEQGLRGEFYDLPPGKYCSLGIHESQSRLWENLVGRSASFWSYFFPRAQASFESALKDVSVDQFVAAINHVEPSLIRVEADEVTYNLHIIVRFELEQALLDGELSVEDLPEAWNSKYEEYLGVRPPTDSDGVLQDVHWSAGLVGYFPTYSIGNLYASQFYDAAEADLGSFDAQFQQGKFEPLKKWLNDNVHEPGMRFTPRELGKKATGIELSHEAMMRHLREKLAPIYAL